MPQPTMQTTTAVHAPGPLPLRVLVLEDERFDRHRLARMCSALEFPCLISNATNLKDLADALASDIFGLILLDHSLPDGTGFDALDMVHLCARNLNAPTLMISGAAQEEIAAKACSAGCHGYLSKDTLTTEIFDRAVHDALGPALNPVPFGKQRFNRTEVGDLLAQITMKNARDVKPMVSRLLRQMRILKNDTEDLNGLELNAIEQNCMSLWAFLLELERQDGSDLLYELGFHEQEAAQASAHISKALKPPSPFSRMSH